MNWVHEDAELSELYWEKSILKKNFKTPATNQSYKELGKKQRPRILPFTHLVEEQAAGQLTAIVAT